MIQLDDILRPRKGSTVADPSWDSNRSAIRHLVPKSADAWKFAIDIDGSFRYWPVVAPHTCHRGAFHENRLEPLRVGEKPEQITEVKGFETGCGVLKLLLDSARRRVGRALPYRIAAEKTPYQISRKGKRRLSCCAAILKRFAKEQICMITPTVEKPPKVYWEAFNHAFVIALNRLIEWVQNRIKAEYFRDKPTDSQQEIDEIELLELCSMGWALEYQKNGMLHAHIVCLQKLSKSQKLLFRYWDLEKIWNRQFRAALKTISGDAEKWLKAFNKQTNCHVATCEKDVWDYVMKYARKAGNAPKGAAILKQYWGVTDAVRTLMDLGRYEGHFDWPKEARAWLADVLLSSSLVTLPFDVNSADGVYRCTTCRTPIFQIPSLAEYLNHLIPSLLWSKSPLNQSWSSIPVSTCLAS